MPSFPLCVVVKVSRFIVVHVHTVQILNPNLFHVIDVVKCPGLSVEDIWRPFVGDSLFSHEYPIRVPLQSLLGGHPALCIQYIYVAF